MKCFHCSYDATAFCIALGDELPVCDLHMQEHPVGAIMGLDREWFTKKAEEVVFRNFIIPVPTV